MNMSKSEKSAYFRHVFYNNFFVWNFSTFQRIQNQQLMLRFWHPYCSFQEIMFLDHISTFCKIWSQTRTKRLQKTKKVFYKCVLEFNLATINSLGEPSCTQDSLEKMRPEHTVVRAGEPADE